MTGVENLSLHRIKMSVIFDGKCLLLLFILALIPRCQTQNCSSNLTNIFFPEGISTSFKRENNRQPVQWAVISSSDFLNEQQIITNYDDVVVSKFNTTYAVTPSGLTIFNLTVAPQGSSPYATAGLYTLRYQNSNCIFGFNLVVISKIALSPDSSDPNNTILSCSRDYAESKIQSNNPYFWWRTNTSVVKQEQPIPYKIDAYLKRSTTHLSIGKSNAAEYYCGVTFNATTKSLYNCITRDISVFPTYGPADGGTSLTIVVECMALENISISAVYIGQNLTADINRTSTENVLVTTPAIQNDLQINQQLPVILEISPNSINITAVKYFAYKPNPRIYDVSPRKFPISGGIRLTLSGTNLDSVAKPIVRGAVFIRRGSVITYYNQSFTSCYPPTQNGTQMICLSPPIYIRDDFLKQLFCKLNPYSNNRRKRETILSYGWKREDRAVLHDAALLSVRSKRSPVISINETYPLPYSEDKMEIDVGIIFDGFRRYENDTLRDCNGSSLHVCSPPNLSHEDNIEFDHNFITIQGGNLTQCSGPSDYTVRIGNGICTVKYLTDNALTCYPPEEKPQQTENDTNYNCGKNFAVIVELGFKVYRYSCLKYPNEDSTKLIIAATVGSFVVGLIIITVIVVVVRKSKKENGQTPIGESIEDQIVEGNYATLDHPIRNANPSTTECKSRATYRRPMDTICVSSTPGNSYTKHISGSFSEFANQLSPENGNYLKPVEGHAQNADEIGGYDTTIG